MAEVPQPEVPPTAEQQALGKEASGRPFEQWSAVDKERMHRDALRASAHRTHGSIDRIVHPN